MNKARAGEDAIRFLAAMVYMAGGKFTIPVVVMEACEGQLRVSEDRETGSIEFAPPNAEVTASTE